MQVCDCTLRKIAGDEDNEELFKFSFLFKFSSFLFIKFSEAPNNWGEGGNLVSIEELLVVLLLLGRKLLI